MKVYEILPSVGGYEAVICATSYINPVENLSDISKDLKGTKPGRILFDLLLANSDEFNRFAEGQFNGQKISYSSLRTVKINDQDTLKHTNSFYTQNKQLLNNGILSSGEKLRFARG